MIIALDLDGTLLTCEPRHCAAARYALASSPGGSQISFDAVNFWSLKRRGQSTLSALSQLGHDSAKFAADVWRDEIENPFWLSFDSVLPGVEQTLYAIKCTGATLALVSSRNDACSARNQIQNLGLMDSFDYVVFVPSVRASEEKAHVLREIGADVYVGDTEADHAASNLAGVACRLVDTGMRSRGFLESRTSASVYSSLAEIFEDGSFK